MIQSRLSPVASRVVRVVDVLFHAVLLTTIFFSGILFSVALPARAAALHGLFTDSMVLQRDRPIPVHGTGAEGERVVVTLAGNEAATTVRDGAWSVTLPPLPAGGPHVLTVAAAEATRLEDVMVGDVWLCTGQSNMAGTLAGYLGRDTEESRRIYAGIPSANPSIRLFKVKVDAADTPQREVVADAAFGSDWRVCDEDAAQLFSATGYLFGRALQPEIGVPVGLIHATLGGTPAESWMSRETLESRPEFASIFTSFATAVADHPRALEAYRKRLEEWQAQPAAERRGKRAPKPPLGPTHVKRPAGLYNFMIAPLHRFPVKGAIWYQGEGNSSRAVQYRTLFPALITSWRQQWGEGDFPFLFVQLAAYRKHDPQPTDSTWPWLREAQARTLALPATGMAVAIDVGKQHDIHPPDKVTVAKRLAAAALRVAYGRDIVAAGPTYDGLSVEGPRAVLRFTNVGAGLVVREVETDGLRAPATALAGFTICGADRRFHPAEARIDGDRVIVQSPQVETPVAVRYAWADFPLCNLFNADGFPAVPFRTDDFPPPEPALPQPKPARGAKPVRAADARPRRTIRESAGQGSRIQTRKVVAQPPAAAGDGWSRFRGPDGGGVAADATSLPLTWSNERGVAWKASVPRGASSPIVVGDLVVVTGYSGYAEDLAAPGDRANLKLHVVAVSRRDGAAAWTATIDPAIEEQDATPRIADHGYASPTPCADDARIYAAFGPSGVVCLDHAGRQLWRTSVGTDTAGFGAAASPIEHGDLVIVNAAIESGSLVALDKATGRVAWRVEGIGRAWTTPTIARLPDGRAELVMHFKDEIRGYDPATGESLWWCRGIPDYIVPGIVMHGDTLFCSGGRQNRTIAVKAGGRGDVTETHRLWEVVVGANVTTPLYHDGHLYWSHDKGLAQCLAVADGATVFQKRYETRERVYASLVLGGGRCYALLRDGTCLVFAAKPEFELLAENRLGDGDAEQFNATPAIDGDRLLLRSTAHLYCVDGR